MGRIKSAWEIALERTESIKVDEDKIRQNAKIEEIKRIAGAFLTDEERKLEKLDKLSSFTEDELKKGLKIALMGSINLSQNKAEDERIERLMILASHILKDEESYSLYVKLLQLVKQYPEHREQLVTQLTESLEPELRQKEQMMKEQYGEEVHLRIEDDKEMMEIIKSNLEKLDGEYMKLIGGAKEKLEAAFA